MKSGNYFLLWMDLLVSYEQIVEIVTFTIISNFCSLHLNFMVLKIAKVLQAFKLQILKTL